jgi:hypothetical protein
MENKDIIENKTLNLILDKLVLIEKKLEVIESEIENIKNSTKNMDTHISFVENVYESVKYPFYYIMNNFSTKKIEVPNQIKLIK